LGCGSFSFGASLRCGFLLVEQLVNLFFQAANILNAFNLQPELAALRLVVKTSNGSVQTFNRIYFKPQ